jgi:hypothetical protein
LALFDAPRLSRFSLPAAAAAVVFLNPWESMTPGLISRFDSWTARRRRAFGCRRHRGGSCPAWPRRRSTKVRALSIGTLPRH